MKIKAILLFLLFSFLGVSQEVDITQSEVFKDSKKNTALLFSLPTEDGGLVTIRGVYSMLFQPKGYYLEYFDKDLNLVKKLDWEESNPNRNIKSAFVRGDSLHIIQYFENGKRKTLEFNVLSSKLSELEFEERNILKIPASELKRTYGLSFNAEGIKSFPIMEKLYFGLVTFSKDYNYFLINLERRKKGKNAQSIYVFSKDFKLQYQQKVERDLLKIEINLAEGYVAAYQNIVLDDENGSVYILDRIPDNKSKSGEPDYYYSLYTVQQGQQLETKLQFSDKYVNSLKLVKANGQLNLIGLYGDQNEDRIKGASYITVDPKTSAITNESFTPFSAQFLNDRYGDKKRAKRRGKEKGINDIVFRDAFITADGEIVVTAEEYYSSEKINPGLNNYQMQANYNFDDIICMRIDKNGVLSWARNIRKNQKGMTYSSFTPILVEEKVYFIINCLKEIEQEEDGLISIEGGDIRKSALMAFSLDSEGEIDYQELIDYRDSDVYYETQQSRVNLELSTVILIGSDGKKKQISRIQF